MRGNWFHTWPIRQPANPQALRYRRRIGDLGFTNPATLGDPAINYKLAAIDWFEPGHGVIDSEISLLNIPAYAVVSEFFARRMATT
jgi:hypothetical protein